MSEELRIGVFVCDCGLNIAGIVDNEEVSRFAAPTRARTRSSGPSPNTS